MKKQESLFEVLKSSLAVPIWPIGTAVTVVDKSNQEVSLVSGITFTISFRKDATEICLLYTLDDRIYRTWKPQELCVEYLENEDDVPEM